ncbi:efflux RND transporter permease subunit, partial [Magnetococcales bacterium HHB-1]
LATAVLLFFLRSFQATIIIAIAIPISIIAAFLAMAATGRTLNVISLAGLAFAVGMVVDPAIVVLENIVRYREKGLSAIKAAFFGANQVWSAIFISTATTVAVFFPVLLLDIEAAQLFGDIAVALSSAVFFSLLVSTLVIPAMSAYFSRMRATEHKTLKEQGADQEWLRPLGRFTLWCNHRWYRRLFIIFFMISSSVGILIYLIPPAEYLPSGNRNLVFGLLLPPPGYNLEEMTQMAQQVEKQLLPYTKPDHPQRGEGPDIKHFFFVARGSIAFLGGAAKNPKEIKALLPVFRGALKEIPGIIGVVNQTTLFGRSIGAGRSLNLAVTGPDLHQLTVLAGTLFREVRAALPGSQVRPIPGLKLDNPELQLIPDRYLLSENGLSMKTLGETIDAYTSGLKVDEVLIDNRKMDLMIRGLEHFLSSSHHLAHLPLINSHGEILPLFSVAELSYTAGPVRVEHLDRERVIALRINPADTMAMERAITLLKKKVVEPMRKKGLPPQTQLRFTEGADQLNLAKEAMQKQLLLAMAITFLLMAALFESFLYPLIILTTVPLAAAGGVIGLKILNLFIFQPLDVLTMLGFIILIGIVVNNAILIVHQTLQFIQQENYSPDRAIAASVSIRLRPILLSTLTSFFGLLPLALFPGAGSELYRGLASVIMGGLLLSTLLTLILTPALLSTLFALKRHSIRSEWRSKR